MLTIRKANDRGHFQNGWLDSNHTFSFGEYYDPAHMGLSVLRVINEDRISAAGGFATHPHRNMEIVTYLVAGELAHKDSMGNGSIIGAGEVQRMSAGRGITHSEFNPSSEKSTHLLQIWLQPKTTGITPSYEQKRFGDEEKQGRLKLLISDDGREDSITAHTDALLYGSLLAAGESVTHRLESNRMAYVQVVSGVLAVNGQQLATGDGASLLDESHITLTGDSRTEILLFDLPRIQ